MYVLLLHLKCPQAECIFTAHTHAHTHTQTIQGSLSTERLPGSYSTLPDDAGAPPSVNTMSGLDDFEEDDLTGNGQDFGSVVRLRLMEEHNENNNVVGFEVHTECLIYM